MLAFCYCNKTLEAISFEKGKALWLTVLEISVHSWLSLLLLSMWQGSTSWWEHMAEEGIRKREREKSFPTIPFKGTPLVT
jgi:hypothetical protein